MVDSNTIGITVCVKSIPFITRLQCVLGYFAGGQGRCHGMNHVFSKFKCYSPNSSTSECDCI